MELTTEQRELIKNLWVKDTILEDVFLRLPGVDRETIENYYEYLEARFYAWF